jgi:hypothetical protein
MTPTAAVAVAVFLLALVWTLHFERIGSERPNSR